MLESLSLLAEAVNREVGVAAVLEVAEDSVAQYVTSEV